MSSTSLATRGLHAREASQHGSVTQRLLSRTASQAPGSASWHGRAAECAHRLHRVEDRAPALLLVSGTQRCSGQGHSTLLVTLPLAACFEALLTIATLHMWMPRCIVGEPLVVMPAHRAPPSASPPPRGNVGNSPSGSLRYTARPAPGHADTPGGRRPRQQGDMDHRRETLPAAQPQHGGTRQPLRIIEDLDAHASTGVAPRGQKNLGAMRMRTPGGVAPAMEGPSS